MSTGPPAIPLTSEAIIGYAACPTNPAFNNYMDKIGHQQERLEAR